MVTERRWTPANRGDPWGTVPIRGEPRRSAANRGRPWPTVADLVPKLLFGNAPPETPFRVPRWARETEFRWVGSQAGVWEPGLWRTRLVRNQGVVAPGFAATRSKPVICEGNFIFPQTGSAY